MTRTFMLPSAEESKAERLKRQQARFRDRGGAFVPSNSNPLVDILLARTVTGESPSKAHPKDVVAKRLSSPTLHLTEENQPAAGRSKPKKPASRKRTSKTVELQGGEVTKPTTKRRGRPAKSNKNASGSDFDVEEPPPNAKSKSKGKGKQRTNQTSSESNAKPKPKTKPKITKKVVEVLSSDDDQTLVEAPQAKPSSKRHLRHGETEEAPLTTTRPIPPVNGSKPCRSGSAEHVKGGRDSGTLRLSNKTLKGVEKRSRDEGHAKTNVKKRTVLHEEEDEGVGPRPTKRGKSTKSNNDIEPKPMPVPRTTRDVQTEEIAEASGGRKGRSHPNRNVAVDGDDEQRPSRPKKRKKAEDDHEDRPQKVVKFVETGPPHSSSLKFKENHSGKRHESVTRTSIKEEFGPAYPKLTIKPPLHTKTSKGPPREVLERIKKSAARYLRGMDSEPDELDCLS